MATEPIIAGGDAPAPGPLARFCLAPRFTAASSNNPRFIFDTVAGRYVVLMFLGSARLPVAQQALQAVQAHRALFDDVRLCLFGVSCQPADRRTLRPSIPGIRFFWDFDYRISRLYGAAVEDPPPVHPVAETVPPALEDARRAGRGQRYRPRWVVLDPTLRVLEILPLSQVDALIKVLHGLPATVDEHAGVPMTAPVLIVPRVFEPELCRDLIAHYQQQGGVESGFMREENGKTVGRLDPAVKRRSDCQIPEGPLRSATRARLHDRLAPMIKAAFNFEVTRVERYIVARYAGDEGGFFQAHRDNTTAGTAHRRFAVSINLDAEAHEGGDLRFPEFGSRMYRPPTGGAVVFSCALLHEATPVTAGVRYCFLPFLFDEAAGAIRARYLASVESDVPSTLGPAAIEPAAMAAGSQPPSASA